MLSLVDPHLTQKLPESWPGARSNPAFSRICSSHFWDLQSYLSQCQSVAIQLELANVFDSSLVKKLEYMIDAGRAWLQKSELLTIWNDSAAFVMDGELWCDQVSKTLVRAVTVTAWIAFLKTHIEAPLRHGGSTSRWSEDLDVLASRPGLLFNFPFYLPNKDIVSQEAVF